MLCGSVLLIQKSPDYVSDSGHVLDSIYMPAVADTLMVFDRLAASSARLRLVSTLG
jgi:hypothetical protein